MDPVDTVDSLVSFDEIARTTFDVGSEFSTTVNVSEEPSSPTFVDPPDSIRRGAPIESDKVVISLAMYGKGSRGVPWWGASANSVEHAYSWLQAHRT